MTTFLCLLAVTTFNADNSAYAAPQSARGDQQHVTIYPQIEDFELAIRGQSADPFFSQPSSGSAAGGYTPPPTFQPSAGLDVSPTAYQNFSGPASPGFPSSGMDSFYSSPTYDPFTNANPLATASPYGAYGGAPMGVYGLNGPQPYRFGWTDRMSIGYIFDGDTTSDNGTDTGSLAVLEVDIIKDYVTQNSNGYIWKFTPEFNYREFTGPGSPNLPPNVFRLAGGIEMTTPKHGPWSLSLGFKPQIASDFRENLNSDAWMFDANATLYFQQSPELTWVLGAFYWDRVDQIILPHAGVIWTPSQYWEWRLIFPNPRVDVFVGNWFNAPTWFYVGGEYHVESYQVTIDPTDYQDQIQMSDWRGYVGLRSDNGYVASFMEVGIAFEREASFRRDDVTLGFSTDPALFLRGGLRF